MLELLYRLFLQVTQCGPSSFFIVMNDSYVEIEAHRMKDGGILINLVGSSYLTFMKEEVDSYRIVVNNKSCVFQKENDPSILRSERERSFRKHSETSVSIQISLGRKTSALYHRRWRCDRSWSSLRGNRSDENGHRTSMSIERTVSHR